MDNSRYGGANPNNIGSTGRVVTNRPGINQIQTEKQPHTIAQHGAGPYVLDVHYDEGTRKTVVTRGDVAGDSIDGQRVGRVMHACTFQTDAQIKAYVAAFKWFPLLTGTQDIDWDNSPLLPDDFEHVDGFSDSVAPVKNLKTIAGGCLAFVRLLPGSSPLGQSCWDADLDDFGKAEACSPNRRPKCVKAVIKTRETGGGSDKVHSVISLYFDANISVRFSQYGTEIVRRVQVATNKGPIKASSATQGHAANIIDVTLLRPISRDEKVYVKILEGVFVSEKQPNIASEVMTAVELKPKACYVIVVNRASDRALAEGDIVQIGKPLTLFDQDKVPMPVYDCMPLGQGGLSFYYGIVLGGNPKSVGSSDRRFLNPVPMFNSDQTALILNPSVPSWGDLELEDDWVPSDGFSADTPLGLGYVLLVRPSEWGTKTWMAAYGLPLDSGTHPDSEIPFATASTYKSTTLKIYWSHGALAIDPGLLAAAITVTDNGTPITVSAAVASSRKITVTLNSAPTTGPVVVTVAADTWKTPSDVKNIEQSVTSTLDAPKGAVVYAVSRISYQGLVAGDLVIMADNKLTITDETEVPATEPVLDILMAVNPHRLPHSHQGFGSGPYGGGPANFNVSSPFVREV